jgi:C1A family cysteine protease
MNLLVVLLLVCVYAEELAVTPEYVEHLKRVATWKVAEYEDNVFKGWTLSEVKQLLGDNQPDQAFFEAEAVKAKNYLPSYVDWADNKCVHSVLDQKNCGSCWAFAAAGVASDKCCLETHPKDYGWLSPQELLNCDGGGGENNGCNGGYAYNAFKYIGENGLVDLNCLPYTASTDSCKRECKNGKDWNEEHKCKCKTVTDCSGFESTKACLNIGPVSARMRVYQDFLGYKEGIYCRTKDAQELSNHAIRCTGYKDDGVVQSVHCANSWGKYWGEKGYFHIKPTMECGYYDGANNVYTVSSCKS